MSLQAFQVRTISSSNHLCVVVGNGLIGSQISHFLNLYSEKHEMSAFVDIDWKQPETIILSISQALNATQAEKLDIVWSAGKCGFGATDSEMSDEYDVYAKVMSYLSGLEIHTTVNFISSAGGIYEHSSQVKTIEQISPRRSYAIWKLKQEDLLTELSLTRRIFRLSSVYGIRHKGCRAGLINTLIEKSKLRADVTIYANQHTLRDYVFNSDIARHVVSRIHGLAGDEIEILASGRVVGINSLINIVRTFTNYPVKALYIDNETNSNDFYFSNSVIPQVFARTSLEEGVRLVSSRTSVE